MRPAQIRRPRRTVPMVNFRVRPICWRGRPMTVTDEAAARRALVERVKNILIQPKEEWAVIDGEPATIKGLYTGYVCILAAIGPVCMALGMILTGRSPLGAMIMGVL